MHDQRMTLLGVRLLHMFVNSCFTVGLSGTQSYEQKIIRLPVSCLFHFIFSEQENHPK